jgi:hypothetical protein
MNAEDLSEHNDGLFIEIRWIVLLQDSFRHGLRPQISPKCVFVEFCSSLAVSHAIKSAIK